MAKFTITSYNISEEDKVTITLCRERFSRDVYAFRRLAEFLQDGTDLPLKDWNEDVGELYISNLKYREWTLRKNIAFLNYALQLSKNPVRISQSLVEKYSVMPYELFYSFAQFDAYINSVRNKQIPNLRYKNTIDVYASMMIVYYLTWLGLDTSEISNLKAKDVDIKTFVLKAGGRTICFEDYYPICSLLKRYATSTGITVYGKPKNYFRKFVEGDAFIKLTKKSSEIRTVTIIQRAKAVFGLSAIQISYSGKYDRMYAFELQNGIDLTKASSRTIPYIEKLLGIKLITDKGYETAMVKEYLREYSDYKTTRQNLELMEKE